ncbi:type I-C CRISPR-associated protein Cas5c [Desulfovibrio sp. QI0430]
MAANLDENILAVKVTGDFACFTRPDLKVERMTYPCMTQSAARGILDCILWKPEFKWYVRRIKVLRSIAFASIKRNEINAKQGLFPIYVEEHRAQRSSIVLRDVAYIIEASIWQDSYDAKNPLKKYAEMFRRRVRQGQCFRQPFLGMREFSCQFMEPTESDRPIEDTIPIGSMFFDMYYGADGKPQPLFAQDVAVRAGILDCEHACNANGSLIEKIMTSSHLRPPLSDGVRELLAFYAAQEEEIAHAQ